MFLLVFLGFIFNGISQAKDKRSIKRLKKNNVNVTFEKVNCGQTTIFFQ